MKIILLIVTSIDGITLQKGGTAEAHHAWTSEEDKKFFDMVRDNASLIFMGSKTYEGARHQMVHKKGKLRIVFTRNPEKYSSETISGQLEFTNEDPRDLIKRLEEKGYTEGLLVGGANTNTQFFKRGLVTELWQTVEPVILGEGIGIITKGTKINMELVSSEKLNEKGTLLLKYKVLN